MTGILGIVHGLDYLFGYLLVGSIVFNFLILPAGGSVAASIDNNRYRKLLLPTLISSILWMFASAYNMTESWALAEIWTAMSTTTLGHLWCARIALLFLALLISRKAKNNKISACIFIFLALILPVISVLASHAASQPNYKEIRMIMGLLHSLAVGVWTGGLWTLINWLRRRNMFLEIDNSISYRIVKRFSIFAIFSTTVIAITGIGMSALSGVSWLSPFATTYGKIVVGKILLFTVTLSVASINQFIHLARWKPSEEKKFISGIYQESWIELIIIMVIFCLAGFLTLTPLPLEF